MLPPPLGVAYARVSFCFFFPGGGWSIAGSLLVKRKTAAEWEGAAEGKGTAAGYRWSGVRPVPCLFCVLVGRAGCVRVGRWRGGAGTATRPFPLAACCRCAQRHPRRGGSAETGGGGRRTRSREGAAAGGRHRWGRSREREAGGTKRAVRRGPLRAGCAVRDLPAAGQHRAVRHGGARVERRSRLGEWRYRTPLAACHHTRAVGRQLLLFSHIAWQGVFLTLGMVACR